jgi:catechol-2,3-dioxygenase
VALRVPDIERSVKFCQDVLGLRTSEELSGTVYLTCNARHHELILVDGAGADAVCEYVGYETPSVSGLEDLRGRVSEAGYETLDHPLDPGEEAAFRFIGPGGSAFKVYTGMQQSQPRDYAAYGPRPRKFGHVGIKTALMAEHLALFTDVLGFRVSDWLEDKAVWLRCHDDHHSVSLIHGDEGLHHHAWELEHFAAMEHFADNLASRGMRMLWGPGRHGIGNNLYIYTPDPDNILVEHYADLDQITDDVQHAPRIWPDEWSSVNTWGPEPPPSFFPWTTPYAAPRILER